MLIVSTQWWHKHHYHARHRFKQSGLTALSSFWLVLPVNGVLNPNPAFALFALWHADIEKILRD